MAYTDEELAIIGRISDQFAPQRDSIAAARSANPEKWFDYQDQLKALNAQVKSAYEKAIADYRAGGTNTNSNKPSFAVYSDLLRQGKDQEAAEYWYGDSENKGQGFLDDYLAALPGGEQGPAQGPNTPVRRDGDMFVPKDFAPPPYRVTPQSKGPRGENLGEIAAEYGGGRSSQQPQQKPQWIKDIERQIPPGRGFTGPYDQFGNPTGVGGTVKQASDDQSTDYAIATASRASDEQRQQQTYQAEYDPQKAQTASAAAKAYKKSAATEDPFRSQAAFG